VVWYQEATAGGPKAQYLIVAWGPEVEAEVVAAAEDGGEVDEEREGLDAADLGSLWASVGREGTRCRVRPAGVGGLH